MKRFRWIHLFIFLIVPASVVGLIWFLRSPEGVSRPETLAQSARVVADLVLLAAVAGVGSMATVQFWKLLFRPRAAFHRAQIQLAFGEHTDDLLRLAGPGFTGSSRAVYTDLLNSPSEILMGQLGSAAEYAMLNPQEYPDLLSQLAGSSGESAVKHLLEMSGPDADEDKVSETLYPVRYFVEQNLDLLLVSLRDRWQRRIRFLAVWVALAIGVIAILLADAGPLVKTATVGAAAVWGGFFAWFARDLVALVERHRA